MKQIYARPVRQHPVQQNKVYLIVLNAGTFYFAGKFLSRDPLVKNGKLTESCLEFYGLTPREALAALYRLKERLDDLAGQ